MKLLLSTLKCHNLFNRNPESFDISQSYIQSTLSMYRIIRNDSTNLDNLPKIRNFFFEERKSGYWRNTYESARIIETILPDMLGDKKKLTDPSAFIHINESSIKVDSFPFCRTLKGCDTVKLSINGDFPVYATLFRKWLNTQPSAISKGFRVKTYFRDHTNTLKAGISVKLFAEIHVLRKASYVMLEIPIPAGCSYEEKDRQNMWEVHREYFKNKVCIFYKDLPVGNYKAEIELLPRFNGKYTINPAKAELMYFPVFFGRNEIQNVIVN